MNSAAGESADSPAVHASAAHASAAQVPAADNFEQRGGADSQGRPWSGRRIESGRFADDIGAADPGVVAALTSLAAAEPGGLAEAESALMSALAGSRVLVPLVAVPDPAGEHHTMATASLTGPDGSRAMPVFTSSAAVTHWDGSARPVPTPVGEACCAALEQGCTAMVVDLAEPHAAVVRLSQLWALSLGEPWVPSHADPVVCSAVAAAARGLGGVVDVRCEDGAIHAPGTLRLVVVLQPGLSARSVDEMIGGLGERLTDDPDVRRRIDDVAVVVHQAIHPADAVPDEPFL